MSTRLRLYVGTLCVAGVVVLAVLLAGVDLDRARQVGGAIVLFAGFVIVGALLSVVASVIADLVRRKGAVKTAFNAAQYVLALAAGGVVYSALGGGHEITTATLPALAAGGLAFMLVNHLLVSAAMVLALAPVAVVVAERSLLLLPALILPLGAVYLASKAEIRAKHDQAEAEEAAERQRRLTEREHEVVRRLQETDRLKTDLINTVSHELRSPLTTIVGVFGILRVRRDKVSPSERDELVAMGIQQSERLHRMIEQLLLAARFEQADVASLLAARVELDATDLVRQAGAEARARHSGRRIAIDTNGALPVKVAQEAVVQVLGNLLDNACKYSPDGEPVRLSGTREGAEAVLAVEDAGPGIPEAERQRIFDRFTQLERSSQRRAGGVGLGLYIARQLARSQDGDLLVGEPAGGHGARFELHLPLLPEAAGS